MSSHPFDTLDSLDSMTQSSIPFQRITIIGLGLIGGSMAMAIREKFPTIWIQGVDRNEEPLQYALKHNIIDEASRTLPTEFEPDHLIILATHLTPNIQFLQELAPIIEGKEVWVTDIGSCKRVINEQGAMSLPNQFIGAHPMSGKEFPGIAYATSLLFVGKLFLLTPSDALKDSPFFHRLDALFKGVGARTATISPEEHDRVVAYVSHLPQLYSVILTNLLFRHEPIHMLSHHGGGIDDQLRLAASPYAMWGDVFRHNKDNLRQVLREMIGVMEEVDAVLDQPELANWFDHANEMHRIFQDILAKRFQTQPNPSA